MPELKLNGKTYSGSTSYASAINYTEDDGSKTTVQDKISELAYRPVNNNLLINSNFANPVNQRGYAQSVVGNEVSSGGIIRYWIDRWKFNYYYANSTITLSMNDDCISIKETDAYENYVMIQQIIEFPEKYAGKKVTASIKYESIGADGLLVIGYSGGYDDIILSRDKTEVSITVELPNDITNLQVQIWNKNSVLKQASELKIYWIKLELGEVATPYVPRLYTEEWLICQRYYQKIDVGNSICVQCQTDFIQFNTLIPIRMRIGGTADVSKVYMRVNYSRKDDYNIEIYQVNANTGFACMRANKKSHGVSYQYYPSLGGTLIIDAEL